MTREKGEEIFNFFPLLSISFGRVNFFFEKAEKSTNEPIFPPLVVCVRPSVRSFAQISVCHHSYFKHPSMASPPFTSRTLDGSGAGDTEEVRKPAITSFKELFDRKVSDCVIVVALKESTFTIRFDSYGSLVLSCSRKKRPRKR